MNSKIIQVRKDLRGLKKNSRVVQHLIEAQGIYYKRIKALKSQEQTADTHKVIEEQRELIRKLEIESFVKKCTDTEKKYMDVLNQLDPIDKAMVLDGFVTGCTYWQLAAKYGFTESSVRKHMDLLMKRIAEKL